MRSNVAAVTVSSLAVLFCVACAAKAAYDLSWSIDRSESAEGGRQRIVSNESESLPLGWNATGSQVRVLGEAPTTPHDTVGFLYWRHTELPLKVKEKKTDCVREKSKCGAGTTVCSGRAYSVTAQCDRGCRRGIIRAVADSLGADAVIAEVETTKFEASSGVARELQESNARNEGFRGTYVMIVRTP